MRPLGSLQHRRGSSAMWRNIVLMLLLSSLGGCHGALPLVRRNSSTADPSVTATHRSDVPAYFTGLNLPRDTRQNASYQSAAELLNSAQQLREDGNLPAARDQLVTLLSQTPSHERGIEMLTSVAASLGDRRLQEAALRHLLDVKPDSAEAHLQVARQFLQLARQDQSQINSPAASIVTEVMKTPDPSLLSTTDPPLIEAALQAYRRAMELEPRNTRAVTELAAALVERNRASEAEAVYRAAVVRNPRDAILAMSAARFFESRQNWAEALKCYDRALEVEPGNRIWRRHRGVCEYSLGDWPAAAFDLRQALIRTPVRPQLAEFQLWAEACLRTNELAEAEQVFDLLASEGGIQAPDLECQRAFVRLRQGRSDEAETIVTQALTTWPQNPDLLKLSRDISTAALALSVR